MKNVWLLALLLVACSHKDSARKGETVPEVKLTEKDIQECTEYERLVLQGAQDQDKKFARDEDTARDYLARFDVNKALPLPKSGIMSGILRECDQERVQRFNVMYKFMNKCNIMFSELEYFQALAGALGEYRWPTDLKLEGKRIALDYVRFYSTGSFPLLNRLVAMSVLDELSVNQVVDKKLHAEIKAHMQEASTFVESLRSRLNTAETLSCQSLDILREEQAYSQKISGTLSELLKRI